VTLEEGQPLTFTASFDTVPAFDPGDLSTIAFRRASSAINDEAMQRRCSGCATARARFEPVEGRGVDHGDTVVLDLERRDAGGAPDKHTDVSIELGAKANPPGFDEQLLGLESGATKSFTIHYPPDYPIGELADTDVSYTVTVKGLKRRVVPELDDEFAKDLGEFDTLEALKARVRETSSTKPSTPPSARIAPS
jgi:trigger factor